MSEETESEVVETAHAKGVRLEKEFSEFLKSDLGWDKTRNRKQMRSQWNMAGTNVDIVAERINDFGERCGRMARLLIKFAIPVFLIAVYFLLDDDLSNDSDGEGLIIVVVIWEIAAFAFLIISRLRNKEHAWAECKNIKTKATIKQLQILVAERNAFISSNDENYKIVETYFVAENGFTETALQYAESHNVKCYERKNETFINAQNWD